MVKQYIQNFNKSIIGITTPPGDLIELKELMKKFKVSSRKVYLNDDKSRYEIDHTSRVYLMDTENKFMDYLDPTLSEQQAAKSILAKIIKQEHLK